MTPRDSSDVYDVGALRVVSQQSSWKELAIAVSVEVRERFVRRHGPAVEVGTRIGCGPERHDGKTARVDDRTPGRHGNCPERSASSLRVAHLDDHDVQS